MVCALLGIAGLFYYSLLPVNIAEWLGAGLSVPIPVSPFTGCVALDKSLTFLDLSFSNSEVEKLL